MQEHISRCPDSFYGKLTDQYFFQQGSVHKRGRRIANQPPQVERTDTHWHIQSAGIERHEENITNKTRQFMTFVLITNVPAATLGDKEILFAYKGQAVVEVQFHLLKTPCLASQVFLKKPQRIEALIGIAGNPVNPVNPFRVSSAYQAHVWLRNLERRDACLKKDEHFRYGYENIFWL